MGPGVQRHHQHRHLRARARDLRLHRGRPAGRLLERGVPRSCSTTGSRCSAPSPRATGRTSARSRPTCRPTRTCSTARSQVDIPGFELSDGVWLGEGAEIHPDATRRRARRSSATNCRVEAGARIGEYTVLGANVRVRGDADLERVRRPRQRLPRPRASACAARSSAGPATCAAASAATRASVLGDECFVGERRRHRRAASRSTRSRRSRPAPSSTRRSCGSRGAPAACSAATAWPAWPTSTSPPSSPPRWPWPTATTLKKGTTVVTSRDSSRSARMLKRAMMAGLNAAGVNVLDLEVASVPVTRFLVRSPVRRRAASPSAWCDDDPQSVVIRFFDAQRRSTSPRTPSARSSGCSTARTSAGCSPPRSATSASRPGPSSTTPSRSRRPSTSSAIRDGRLQGGRRLRATARRRS